MVLRSLNPLIGHFLSSGPALQELFQFASCEPPPAKGSSERLMTEAAGNPVGSPSGSYASYITVKSVLATSKNETLENDYNRDLFWRGIRTLTCLSVSSGVGSQKKQATSIYQKGAPSQGGTFSCLVPSLGIFRSGISTLPIGTVWHLVLPLPEMLDGNCLSFHFLSQAVGDASRRWPQNG